VASQKEVIENTKMAKVIRDSQSPGECSGNVNTLPEGIFE